MDEKMVLVLTIGLKAPHRLAKRMNCLNVTNRNILFGIQM